MRAILSYEGISVNSEYHFGNVAHILVHQLFEKKDVKDARSGKMLEMVLAYCKNDEERKALLNAKRKKDEKTVFELIESCKDDEGMSFAMIVEKYKE